MGRGSKEQKRVYVRALSSHLRRWSPKSSEVDYVADDPVILLEGLGRGVMMILGRNRQRLLSQAWGYWTKNSGVVHDYASDVVAILSREIAVGEQRTELEIEVLHKWALQQGSKDPTGLAAAVLQCKSRAIIVDVFQQCRLEMYHPGDVVLFQGQLPQQEDGHFTLLEGSCDVINLQEGSVSAIRLLEYARRSRFEAARQLLQAHSQPLATMHAPAGFGELSCMTGVKRHATIRAGVHGASFLVVPQPCMRACLEARRSAVTGIAGSSPSEAIELFRQFGLASKISPRDLTHAANHMVKRTVELGDLLYSKGQPCNSIYLIVSGDFVLDTGDPVGINTVGKEPHEFAFLSSIQDNCFHMTSGGILGDEGVIGLEQLYESTAAVASETGVIFEAQGFARAFLMERIRAMRYTALTYKEMPRWSLPIPFAELNNIFGSINSLRKLIAHSRPLRGTVDNPYLLAADTIPTFTTPAQLHRRQEALKTNQQQQIKTQVKKEASQFLKVNGLGLLFLKHINVTCKRHASERLKLHARENILTDSLMHTAATDGPKMVGRAETLVIRLQRGVDAYHERNRADVCDDTDEGPRVTLAAASNMLGMLASAASSAMKRGEPRADSGATEEEIGATGDENLEKSDPADDDGVSDEKSQKSETDAQSVATRLSHVSSSSSHDSSWFQRTRDILARPRIQQYFLYLERTRGILANAATMTLSLNDQEEQVAAATGDPHEIGAAEGGDDAAAAPPPLVSFNLAASPVKNAEIYWRPPSPSATRPADPIIAALKSRPAAKKVRELNSQPLWPKRDCGRKSPGEGTGEPSLESLRFNPKTYMERILHTPSSGYGQSKAAVTLASRAQQALQDLQSFERLTAPNTRRIALLDWQLVQQTQHIQLTSAKAKPDKVQTGKGQGDEVENKSTGASLFPPEPTSFDLGDPAQFLKLLNDKAFEVRSQHKPKNVWRTRTMKVTQNATEVQEDGSVWFQRKMAALGLQDADLKNPPLRRFQGKGRRTCGILGAEHEREQEKVEKVEKVAEEHEEREEHEKQVWDGIPASLDTWESASQESAGGGEAEAVQRSTEQEETVQVQENVATPRRMHQELSSPGVLTSSPRGASRGTIAVVPEPSALKEPSKALVKFKEALEAESSSRRYLDGRKRHDSMTKFQLDPPLVAVDDIKAMRRAQELSNKSANENLLQALWPPGVVRAKPFGAVKAKPIKSKTTTTTTHSILTSLVDSLGTAEAGPQSSGEGGGDRDLQEWQRFSVAVSLLHKHGPSASLPVLAGVSADPAEPRKKKSSLNFSNRLARLPGSEESRPTVAESYLVVFQRQFDKSKKKASRLY